VTHKLSKTLQDIQAEFFRVLKDSQTGTWENAGTQKNIKITKKPVKDNAMGYIKGEGMIIGFSPDEVMAVQAIVECKKICKLPEKQIIFFAVRPDIDIFFSPGDPMLEDVVLIEGLSPTEEIDHVIMKGQMGVS